jgi:general secretion pathway protein G
VESKEAQLRQNLFTLRDEIQRYTLDKQKAPQALEDLVNSGYIRQIRQDPITGKADWALDMEDALLAVDQPEPGIWDVHSRSELTELNGTTYRSW